MYSVKTTEDAKPKRFLRVNNVVRRTGVPERTIRHWAATGQLPAIRLGEKIWAFEPAVVEVLQERLRYEAAG
jgi:DNA-binding transcriptional MerR regulator